MEYQESQEYLMRTCLKIYQINKKKINSTKRNTCKKCVLFKKENERGQRKEGEIEGEGCGREEEKESITMSSSL